MAMCCKIHNFWPRYEPIGRVDFAALLNIEDGLITKIKLFYDVRPFEKNR